MSNRSTKVHLSLILALLCHCTKYLLNYVKLTVGFVSKLIDMELSSNTPRRSIYGPTVDDHSFVFSDGAHKLGDKEVQRKVRANAMRDYWRRRKLETKKVPAHCSNRSHSVKFKIAPSDLGFKNPERVWRWEVGSSKPSSGLTEEPMEEEGCSSRHEVKKVAAEGHLLPSHAVTQTANACNPPRGETGKNPHHEGLPLDEGSITSLSMSVGNGMVDPFNATALEGSRYNSFLLSQRTRSLSYAMPQLGKRYTSQRCNTDHGWTKIVVAVNDDTPQRKGFFSNLWLPTAIQEPTLLWSTLTFAAIWLESLGLQYAGFQPLSYKARIIGSLNKNLRSSRTAISNSTIAVVALLAGVAVSLISSHVPAIYTYKALR